MCVYYFFSYGSFKVCYRFKSKIQCHKKNNTKKMPMYILYMFLILYRLHNTIPIVLLAVWRLPDWRNRAQLFDALLKFYATLCQPYFLDWPLPFLSHLSSLSSRFSMSVGLTGYFKFCFFNQKDELCMKLLPYNSRSTLYYKNIGYSGSRMNIFF